MPGEFHLASFDRMLNNQNLELSHYMLFDCQIIAINTCLELMLL